MPVHRKDRGWQDSTGKAGGGTRDGRPARSKNGTQGAGRLPLLLPLLLPLHTTAKRGDGKGQRCATHSGTANWKSNIKFQKEIVSRLFSCLYSRPD
jgi:hypothetical protein